MNNPWEEILDPQYSQEKNSDSRRHNDMRPTEFSKLYGDLLFSLKKKNNQSYEEQDFC